MKKNILILGTLALGLMFTSCQKEADFKKEAGKNVKPINKTLVYFAHAAAALEYSVNFTNGSLQSGETYDYGIRGIAYDHNTGVTYYLIEGDDRGVYTESNGQLTHLWDISGTYIYNRDAMEIEFNPSTNELWAYIAPSESGWPVLYKCTNLSTGTFDYLDINPSISNLSAENTSMCFTSNGTGCLIVIDPVGTSPRCIKGYTVNSNGVPTLISTITLNSSYINTVFDDIASVYYPSTSKFYLNINHSLYRWDSSTLTLIGSNGIGSDDVPDMTLMSSYE